LIQINLFGSGPTKGIPSSSEKGRPVERFAQDGRRYPLLRLAQASASMNMMNAAVTPATNRALSIGICVAPPFRGLGSTRARCTFRGRKHGWQKKKMCLERFERGPTLFLLGGRPKTVPKRWGRPCSASPSSLTPGASPVRLEEDHAGGRRGYSRPNLPRSRHRVGIRDFQVSKRDQPILQHFADGFGSG
jgi:hypothetical protein